MFKRELVERSDFSGYGPFIIKDSKDIPTYLGILGRESVCTESEWKGFKGR